MFSVRNVISIRPVISFLGCLLIANIAESQTVAATPPSLATVLALDGFSEVRPASLLLAPGSVVVIRSRQPFRADLLCSASDAFGTHFTTESSPAQNQSYSSSAGGSASIDADVFSQLKTDVGFSRVLGVWLTLSDARVFELSKSQAFEHVAERRAGCQRAIDDAYASGSLVTVVTKAFKADVQARLITDADASVSGETRSKVLRGLALKLGLSANAAHESSVGGRGLYWGIADDGRLADLRSDKTTVARRKGTHESRLWIEGDTSAMRRIPADVTLDLRTDTSTAARH